MATARIFKTKDEFAQALLRLTPAEKARLRHASVHVAQVADVDAEDLLQEAITRALAGKRRWPDHVDIVTFLAMVMKSLASAGQRSAARRPERDPDDEGDPDIYEDKNPEGLGQRADEILISEERRRAILAMFDGDDEAQLIVEGMLGGMEGEELRKFVDLNPTQYASKRRKIRRTLNLTYTARKDSK
jgi:DNA-directed RNA polymerase specialized sigma24 family protein